MSYSNNSNHHVHIGRVIRDLQKASGRQKRVLSGTPDGNTPSDATMEDLERQVREAYERGLTEGRAAAEREFSELTHVFRNAVDAFNQARQEMVGGLDEHVVVLALAIARRVIDREVHDADTLRGILLRALGQMPDRSGTRARLNPADLAMLEANRERIQASGSPLPEELVLSPDSGVNRGGCLLEGPHGSVDATIDSQLTLIEEALRSCNGPDRGQE